MSGMALVPVRAQRATAAFTATAAAVAAAASQTRSILLTLLAVNFAAAVLFGPASSMTARIWRHVPALRAGEREPAAAVRFAAVAGLGVTAVAAVGHLTGSTRTAVGALVLLAALSGLLAGANICLGCRLYGLLQRGKVRLS